MNFLIENWFLVVAAVVSGGMLLWPLLASGGQGAAVTPATLSQACQMPLLRAQTWAPCISDAVERFNVQAVAMFLAQIAHESGCFQYVREIWGPTRAQAQYGQRADLGNTKPEAATAE